MPSLSVNLETMAPSTGERFERAVAIMARLRAPGGCPWDREQNFDSIKPHTLEEVFEVLEAIDNRDWEELPGELGDLLLQVLFYAQMAKEDGTFSVDDVLDRLSEKLVRRHPHVFGDVKAETTGEVLRNWEAIKAQEKQSARPGAEGTGVTKTGVVSALAGVSSGLPALLEAGKLSARAADVGFGNRPVRTECGGCGNTQVAFSVSPRPSRSASGRPDDTSDLPPLYRM